MIPEMMTCATRGNICSCGDPKCTGIHQYLQTVQSVEPNLVQASIMTQQASAMLANPNISAEEKATAIQMLSDALAISTDVIERRGGIRT